MFKKGFKKIAALSPAQLDKAGLGLLAVPTVAHLAKSVKEKKPGEAALSGAELGGLGLLYRSVQKAHPA